MEVGSTGRILGKVHRTHDDCGGKNRFLSWIGKYEYSRFMFPTCFSSLSQPFPIKRAQQVDTVSDISPLNNSQSSEI